MKRKCVLLAAVLVFSTSVAQAQKSPSPGRLKVGMLLTLSGSFATAGEDGRKGVEAGLAVAGARNLLEIIYADSRNEPATAISEFRRLVEVDQALAVYTHRGPIGMSLNPVSLKAAVPLLGCVGNKDFAAENEFALQLWPRSDEEGEFLAGEFIKRKYTRAVLIYTEDDWTGAVSRGFREKFLSGGGTLLLDQSVMPGEADFRTLLLKAKKSAPDAVYMNLLLPQIGAIVKQARELELAAPFFSNFYATRKDVSEAAGKAALEGVRYVELDTDLPALKAALDKDAAEAPAGLTIAAYVTTMLLAQVAAENKDIKSPLQLHELLLRQREIRTPDYVYPIVNRYVKFPLVLKAIHEGKGGRES